MDQFIGQGREAINPILRVALFDRYVFAFDIADALQLCTQSRGPMRRTGKTPGQKTYPEILPVCCAAAENPLSARQLSVNR